MSGHRVLKLSSTSRVLLEHLLHVPMDNLERLDASVDVELLQCWDCGGTGSHLQATRSAGLANLATWGRLGGGPSCGAMSAVIPVAASSAFNADRPGAGCVERSKGLRWCSDDAGRWMTCPPWGVGAHVLLDQGASAHHGCIELWGDQPGRLV